MSNARQGEEKDPPCEGEIDLRSHVWGGGSYLRQGCRVYRPGGQPFPHTECRGTENKKK